MAESEPYFPVNITLEDAREAVKGRVDFKEQFGPDYVSFTYFTGMAPDIFPDPYEYNDPKTRRQMKVRRELRGLIFSLSSGKVISRRFHKFFNIGELPETNPDRIDLSHPFVLLEKLDGSMISPFYSEGELRFCTKAGVTDTGEFAEQYVKSAPYPYAEFSKEWIAKGYTPIFEFCSPHQQIVLEYQNDSMHLLALRNMETGEYISYEETKLIAEKANIPIVKQWALSDFGLDSVPNIHVLMDIVKSQKGLEGFVLRFQDGRHYKIKTTWYFSIHRSLQFLKHNGERHVWEAILRDTYDDVKAFLPPEYRQAIDKFAADLLSTLRESAENLIEQIRAGRKAAQGDKNVFAKNTLAKCEHGIIRKLLRKIWDYMDQKGVNEDEIAVADVVQILAKEATNYLTSKKAMKTLEPITKGLTYESYRPKSNAKHSPATTPSE